MTERRLVLLLVVLAASVPYLPTLDDYFVQDDFGVVGLLSGKPAGYFPRWFVSTWMDDIWGYTPDEIRPFPAVTYQAAAWWGAASPVANHVINVGFHAVNAMLVFGIAQTAAGLALGPAAFAALVFALLPMQTESVAWVTGRVDSMPACFYLASFLLYARWRGRPRAAVYLWSVVLYFVALFTKQNAVTLPAALVLYDALVANRPLRPSWSALRPYLPFAALTLGYLGLRYWLFGEVARESMLTAARVELFLQDLSIHLQRMVTGVAAPGGSGVTIAAYVLVGAAVIAAIGVRLGEPGHSRVRPAAYFLVVWIGLAIAPTLVAGYASPRHMYLASAGWALALGCALDVLWRARPDPLMRRLGVVGAGALLVMYGSQLWQDVQLWRVRSEVSRRAVADVEREALAAPQGTLVIVDAPQRSWNFALPHALRPPFTGVDLTRRVRVISHSSIHCCPAHLWETYTREAMRSWNADPTRPPVVALRWDPDTGLLYRLSDREDPLLRTLVGTLRDTRDVASLDRMLLDISRNLVVTREPSGAP
jgi:hypothetical protein